MSDNLTSLDVKRAELEELDFMHRYYPMKYPNFIEQEAKMKEEIANIEKVR